MPVAVVYNTRIRVLCDGCGTESAEVYGARDMPVMATVAALRKFKAVGWRHEATRNGPCARAVPFAMQNCNVEAGAAFQS